MKFFDDINIEKLNSLLKFKTKDNNFKIKGSIELYTMKNTIKEKKTVIKRINDFLDEKYKETFINNELMKQQEQEQTNNEAENGSNSGNNNSKSENNEYGKDFYEQKRRLSVTSDYYMNNNTSNNGSTNSATNLDALNENGNSKNNFEIGNRRPSSTGSLPPNKKRRSSSSSYSLKLNDEKLNKIINDTEYFMKLKQQQNGSKRRTSSTVGAECNSNGVTDNFEEEQLDFKNFDFQMGPFGNISDPQARKLFSQIIMILNSSFQDHDFVKIISPLDFKELPLDVWQAEFNNIINTDVTGVKAASKNVDLSSEMSPTGSNNHSNESIEKKDSPVDDAFVPPTTERLSGLNSNDVWNILNNKIALDSCFKILEYSPTTQDNIEELEQYNKVMNEQLNKKPTSVGDPNSSTNEIDEEIKIEHPHINKKDFLKDELDKNDGSYVWSKLWFLINKKMKRVAFINIICSRTTSADESDLGEEDHYYLDDEDAVVITSDEDGDDENAVGYGKKGTELVNSEYNEDYDDYDDDLDYAIESDDESE
ncbi:hypothetical protein ACO0SA_003419 [Hanseniaspora valbyensis]